ncbi:hypothetical protein D9619_002204 [Psilocybe cf. subviscida]|uniref:Uncharacterized protein n=1 Tax=Psilocybe cf. subviscida TaxID=2480587 RepID=A0A8H5BGA3_9AGAR|nr:hypothetical protein D9619_002204 [Psilocybe cf. subviscida]
MHIHSTTNPLSRTEGNVPVAVFIFEDRRKFVRVSEDHFDTLERVARVFDIADDAVLSIHTSSLDVCRGVAVEIDESAYPFMWTVLDEITVKVEGTKARELAIPTPRATPFAEVSRHSTSKASSSRLAAENFDDEEQIEEQEVAMGVNAEANDDEFADAEEAYQRELLLEAEAVAEAEAAAKAEAEAMAEAEAEAAAAELAWDFTDERPQKGKSRSETAESTPTSKFKPTRSVFGSKKGRDDRSVKSEETVIEPPREATSRSVHRNSPHKEPAASRTAAAADNDPRFEITILGPESYQVAQFKTRGKHPVRKVLAAACKLFEVDYNSAHLYLGVRSEKGTRGAVKCEVDATMTQCGVDSHSRLYVRVNTGDGELDSEEEDV